MSSKTDRNGNITTYIYDIMGHLLSVSVTDNMGIILPEYMQYSYTKTGAMLSKENENIITVYAYDNLGRVIKETENVNNTEKLYSYDLSGNRLSFILKVDGVQIGNTTYTYDSLNRMVTTSDDGVLTATYTYDANGNRASLVYSNGITTTYTYNKANLVTEMYNKKGTEILSSSVYTYYLDGNQATKTDETGKMTIYEYDGLRRLISESENGLTKTYTYDKASNRSSMTVSGAEIYTVEYTYDANNRLISDTKTGDDSETITTYTYDNNGNQILSVEGTDIYTNEYDAFSSLISASKNGVVLGSYTYKADGMRLTKTVNGEKTTHVWDGTNIVLELSTSNNIIDRYIRGINLIKSELNGFYLYNAHGDVVQLVNTSSVVTKNYAFDAFGVEINIEDNDANPFRYSGEYFDSETGSIYLRARYYDPATSRMLSEDAIRAGLNWYTYANNNPIMFIDPFGTDAILVTKPVDKNPFGAIDHMGAFFQDENDDWWFFFWGPNVRYEKIDDISIFESIEKMNEYLFAKGLFNFENKCYHDSVYVKGDFTASNAAAKALLAAFDQDIETFNISPETFMKNLEYGFFSKNCGQVVVELFSLGTLPDGTNAGKFAYPKNGRLGGYGCSKDNVLPNMHMYTLQCVFFNEATNIEGFNTAIAKQQKKYKGKNRFTRWWYKNLRIAVDTIK